MNPAGLHAPNGYLVVTPDNETDFDTIESDIRAICSRFQVLSTAYDPWQAAQMSQRLRAEGLPMFEFRATTQNFSPPSSSSMPRCARGGCGMMKIRCWNGV
jgi:phage terminase large subunit-like protein